ncbi:thermophilic desulfurizing enzyme family protein [Diplodia corticola]|uniref:Thermophilic desulfurizing enzyme family protein n=1 Tax=Diplodia corticola TaxID=236234 RepID=A0A1J9SDX0_9PEZI|nr:thermophilic desulfurizing enzyme family protein [Diplodia corticola]OJD38028.1 thermophilic desulfurizing enzyme family protein [Diplodia corticola]
MATIINGHSTHGGGIPPPATDPAIYEEYRFKWSVLPSSADEWLDRAADVKEVLARDAAKRDRENKTPRAEIALLKHSGLLKVLGPRQYGGGGQPWAVGYKAVREVAKGDGSIGMLLGYHLLWSTTANVVGTAEQAEALQEYIVGNNLFLGGAVNPRDNDLKVTSEGDTLVWNGFKNFNTGGVISDLTVLEGVLEGAPAGEDHIFTVVRTEQPGIQFAYNWDNIGLRLTESGSVRIDNVVVPWSDALGWDASTRKPNPNVLGIPYATLLLPTIQLIFSNFYLGIAQGALDAAAAYTRKSTRAWPYVTGGTRSDAKDTPLDEFYVLERYGHFHARLAAADALADRAGHAASKLYAAYNHHGHRDTDTHIDVALPHDSSAETLTRIDVAHQHRTDNRPRLTARQRGEFAELVAAVKVVTTDVGLEVTSGVFEVTGSRATAAGVGLDRFWRDVRTHSLHDPVAYKRRELGRWVLLDEVPEVTWYT